MKTQQIEIPKGCNYVEVDHANGLVLMHIEDYNYFKGELVLMRDYENQLWVPVIFWGYKKDKYVSLSLDGEHNPLWKQCTKFDKELMGTSNKPTN
jgi:hypothetical protein